MALFRDTCYVGVNNNLTTWISSVLYLVLAEGITSCNSKGDCFIFRAKRSSRRETKKQPKIREILSHGVRYGNYVNRSSLEITTSLTLNITDKQMDNLSL